MPLKFKLVQGELWSEAKRRIKYWSNKVVILLDKRSLNSEFDSSLVLQLLFEYTVTSHNDSVDGTRW